MKIGSVTYLKNKAATRAPVAGPAQYTQCCDHTAEPLISDIITAGPKLRAGFMEAPETFMLMNRE